MRAKNLLPFVSSILLAVLSSGCVTYNMWSDSMLDRWNEPASDPHLRLFQSGTNFLVVYDEYRERSDSNRTRAYFLNENQNRIRTNRRPAFTSTNAVRALAPVPVFITTECYGTNSLPAFAVVETNQHLFTIYTGARGTNRCELPVYNDGKGKAVRVLLTPLTVTADLTIVGCIVGYAYACGQTSGYNPSY